MFNIFSSKNDKAWSEFKLYSTTKHGRVYLSNIMLSEGQTDKYLWNIHTSPISFEANYSFAVGYDTPNCAATTTLHSSIDTTLKSAAYFALFGLLGFSVVWLFLILQLVYYRLHQN